jgi:glycine cleavage system H protein
VNPSLNAHPDLVNADPYGEGWMIKLEVSNPADIDALMDAEAYSASVS